MINKSNDKTTTMKKLITICLLLATTFSVKAQENLTQLKSDVIDQLSKGEKVYTPKGNYNRIYDFKILSDCILQVDQFAEPIRPGGKEYGDGAYFLRNTIDFSRVSQVESNVTNYGYKCLTFYADGQPLSQQYYDNDTHSYEDAINQSAISLATDNEQLLDLFQQWAKQCGGN